MNPVIVEEYRGTTLENVHHGLVCIVNERKEVIYEKGNSETAVYYRSAMKPIQAIPLFKTNIIEKYRLTEEEAALFCASQRGELAHERSLESLLKKLELAEEQLICGKSYPLNEEAKEAYIKANKGKRKLLHNCAGKHIGFLAYAKEYGLDMTHYDGLEHPLQKAIYQSLMMMSEADSSEIQRGFDGCGAPVYSIPLQNIAISYLKFAMPELIKDEATKEAVVKIGQVMQAHPTMIASPNFICTILLEDDNIIAKGGAQGVYCLALKKEKISIALKVLSGSELVWPILVAEILAYLEYDNVETIAKLKKLRSNNILNDNGQVIGSTKVIL